MATMETSPAVVPPAAPSLHGRELKTEPVTEGCSRVLLLYRSSLSMHVSASEHTPKVRTRACGGAKTAASTMRRRAFARIARALYTRTHNLIYLTSSAPE